MFFAVHDEVRDNLDLATVEIDEHKANRVAESVKAFRGLRDGEPIPASPRRRRGAFAFATGGTNDAAAMALRTRSLIVLSLAALLILSHAFIPIEQFIHRGDDAFYYFEVAANFPQLGFWTFDRIHQTNGVQPLWMIILTAAAQGADWLGVHDKDVLARVFVGLAGAAHFAASFVLFHVLARTVSTGTAIAAAGAFLFPMGIVWQRVWGLENSLYALLLISTIAYYHLGYLDKATIRRSVTLGAFLGFTTLARLNAGFLIPCLLAHYLFVTRHQGFAERFKQSFISGLAASLLIGFYLAYNFITTDHLLPVSGAAKLDAAQYFLETIGLAAPPTSLSYWAGLFSNQYHHIVWFITSRGLDGMWIAGSRLIFDENSGIAFNYFLSICAVILLLPVVLGRPWEWTKFLISRFRRISVFSYVLVFGAIDTVISFSLYPHQIKYSIIKWWLVENEIVIVVVTATLTTASIAYIAARFLDSRRQAILVPLTLCVFVAFHIQEQVRFYWIDDRQYRDWNKSVSEEFYLAVEWLNTNIPEDMIVGAWNAGLMGYYSKQRVVNLDGVINNFEYLPYLRERRIGDYIGEQNIGYVADFQVMFDRHGLSKQLNLELVYSHKTDRWKVPFVIYKVLN